MHSQPLGHTPEREYVLKAKERTNMKKSIFIVMALVGLLIISGCQSSPEEDIVISKNDGAFEEKISQTLPASEDIPTVEKDTLQWHDTFTSTDGSVSFVIDIDEGIAANAKQVVEVVPHALSSSDIQRVAEALLGNVMFYERRPSQDPKYSRAQYQQMIRRFAPYINQDKLNELMGEDTYLEYIQAYIELWTKKLEMASEEDPRVPCDWMLKKERHYNNSEAETEGRQIEEDSDVLLANAEKNGIEYILSAISKSDGSYKVNRINLNLTEGLGLYPVDRAIYRSMVCRTDKPSQEQIDAVTQKASQILEEMQLGKWSISDTSVESEEIGNAVEYIIEIVAAPVLGEDTVLLGQNLGNYKDAYNATYPTTYVEFKFSANGDLIYFNLDSPLDIVEVPNERVATMSAVDLMELCKKNLSYRDAGGFGLSSDTVTSLEMSNEENILCQVTISKVQYGLGRMMVANKDDHFYYIPVLVLNGVAEYIGEKSGRCYYSSNYDLENEESALIWINAIDGSIVN